ncbi:MAG: hypothetical protein ABI346_02100 [Candidatus Baltobacteraceae bacterium]
MKTAQIVVATLALAAIGLGPRTPVAATPATPATPVDPYAALRLYEGTWDLVPDGPGKANVRLENHCAKTGLFFSCEQIVDTKSVALVVFLPVGGPAGSTQEYRTDALLTDGSAPREWGKLTIEGDRWVYRSQDTENGKQVYWRTANVFTGTDRIHFEVARSDDGANWTTQHSGDERRVK